MVVYNNNNNNNNISAFVSRYFIKITARAIIITAAIGNSHNLVAAKVQPCDQTSATPDQQLDCDIPPRQLPEALWSTKQAR